MSEAGSRAGYSRSRSRSPRRERRQSRSPRRSYSPRSKSPSPRRDRRRSRSPRRDAHHDGSRGSYRASERSSGGGGGAGQGRRVYVGNLPYDVKWTHLKDFMRTAGNVVHADVLLQADGRSKGCGVVEYATASEAQRAISDLSNQTLNGRMVYIREDREQDKGFVGGRGGYGAPVRSNMGGYHSQSSAIVGQITQPQIYVTNLPYSVGWQDLKDLFRNAGNVLRADVQTGYDGRSKGTGVVLFESAADAQNAYKQFQNYDWQGRLLDIKEDRFATSGRGGYGGASHDRGGYGGGRGMAGSRGGFQARGGYSGSDGGGGSYGRDHNGGYEPYHAPAPAVVEPNPFTDDAWPNGEPSATIFVKNLPWSTSNDDLIELFSTIGKVERAEICYESNGRSKGTGVVQFDVHDTASIAIQKFMGYAYGGRPLGLSFVRYGEAPAAGNYNQGSMAGYPTGPAAGSGWNQQQQQPEFDVQMS